MSINHRTAGSTEIIRLTGRLTLGEASGALREWIRGAVHLKCDVLVDLSGVTYVDSAGLGELVASYNSITAVGRQMKLLRPGSRVDSLLHITKLYSTFEIFEDEAAALASFREAVKRV
jgi:anti-sigma B factor antagonist